MFFEYVENKNTKASQNYWFNVLDIDGDGYRRIGLLFLLSEREKERPRERER